MRLTVHALVCRFDLFTVAICGITEHAASGASKPCPQSLSPQPRLPPRSALSAQKEKQSQKACRSSANDSLVGFPGGTRNQHEAFPEGRAIQDEATEMLELGKDKVDARATLVDKSAKSSRCST